MALLTIDTSVLQINKKSVDVKPTGALFDKAQEVQIEMLEDQPRENETILDFKKRDRKAAQDMKKFVKQTLSLTTKEFDKINDSIENDKLIQFGEYLSLMLQGSSFESFADYQSIMLDQEVEDADEDPKSSKEDDEN